MLLSEVKQPRRLNSGDLKRVAREVADLMGVDLDDVLIGESGNDEHTHDRRGRLLPASEWIPVTKWTVHLVDRSIKKVMRKALAAEGFWLDNTEPARNTFKFMGIITVLFERKVRST